MIDPSPRWVQEAQSGLTQWYGHVHLLPRHVLGQWICWDRETGQLLWERSLGRPNTISGVAEGVIVATEMRSGGPWTSTFGAYGISLASGEMLWSSQGPGFWSRLVSAFRAGIGLGEGERAEGLSGRTVMSAGGRRVEVETGRDRGPEPLGSKAREATTAAGLFYRDKTILLERLGQLHLDLPSLAASDRSPARESVRFYLSTAAGGIAWDLALEKSGRQIETNFYGYRLAPPWLYLLTFQLRALGSSTPPSEPAPPQGCELWTVDLRSGEVVQRIPIVQGGPGPCRIEDVDDRGVLVSRKRTVCYFSRTSEGGSAQAD